MQNVSIATLTTNQLCLVVSYTKGHETPLYAFLRLMCQSTENIFIQIVDGIEGCIDIESLNSSQICSLFATDVDALDIVDITPAIAITEILITRNVISTSSLQTTTSSIPVTSHLQPSSTLALSTTRTPSITAIGE